jgi:hypothetical protein
MKTIIQSKCISLLLVIFVLNACSQVNNTGIDTLEFQIGYPNYRKSAYEQLTNYPSPRYKSFNNFHRLFNWINTAKLGGAGIPGIDKSVSNAKSILFQKELALNWNYCFVMRPHALFTDKAINDPSTNYKAMIDLVNQYPEIPLGIITFWPDSYKRSSDNSKQKTNTYRKDFPDSFYIKNKEGIVTKRVLNFAAPDSLFIQDGQIQKTFIESIIHYLKRPINTINDNAEEPPRAFSDKELEEDADMIADKNKLGIATWKVYKAQKKARFRNLYKSQIVDSIAECKNTEFTFYCTEGGPIDRFDWNTIKISNTKIKGNYYSTPDFYVRWPYNWPKWAGAWHGWKWINDGRTVEIKSGDRFFSPFVAAGWANNPEVDVRPAQWLGLLKCLSVVGAEYFYTGYFVLKQPFPDPSDYVWQEAMPAYAQAISTFYEDVFFDGNVLFDEQDKPIVTYPSNADDILVAVRKHNQKEKYVIAATVQPKSNSKRFPLTKDVEIKIGNETLILNANRQGSVFIFDKSQNPSILYQLDAWHQYQHPDRWSTCWKNDAEVFDKAVSNQIIKSTYKQIGNIIDARNLIAYIRLNEHDWVNYLIAGRDIQHLQEKKFVWLKVKSEAASTVSVKVNTNEKKLAVKKSADWIWIYVALANTDLDLAINNLQITCLTSSIMIDKIIVNDNALSAE